MILDIIWLIQVVFSYLKLWEILVWFFGSSIFRKPCKQKANPYRELVKNIQINVNKETLSKGLPTLVTHQIKLKMLQYEAELLKDALENTSKGSV